MNTIEQDIIELRGLVHPFIVAHPSKRMHIVEWTFLHALERVDCGLHSIHTLAKENLVEHEHGIGLISRTLLSDFLIIGHSVRTSSQATIEAELMPLFRSDMEKVKAHVKRFHDNGQLTTEEYLNHAVGEGLNRTIGDIVEDYYQTNPDPVDNNGKANKKQWSSNSNIAEEAMRMKPPSRLAVNIWRAYDQWFYYSKYEHIGWHSFVLTRGNTEETMEDRLRRALVTTSVLICLCFAMLEEHEELERSIVVMNRLFNEASFPADYLANPACEFVKPKL